MPNIVGGIRIAKIDAAFDVEVKGKKHRFRVRENAAFPKAAKVARCLGQRRNGALVPCTHCQEAKAEGETGLDGLYKSHPTEMQLRKQHEQHVFALLSLDPLDPEGTAQRQKIHDERLLALKETKSALERQALTTEWGYDPRYVTPTVELVGLLSSEIWGDSRTDVTM